MNIHWWRILLTILSMSLSGSVLFLLYLALRKIFKKHLPPRASYVILILVILRMLIPFSPDSSLMNTLYRHLTTPASAGQAMGDRHDEDLSAVPPETANGETTAYTLHGQTRIAQERNPRQIAPWKDTVAMIWLFTAFTIFTVNTSGYFFWCRYILSLADCCVLHKRFLDKMTVRKRRLDVMVSRRVHSPMLVGVTDPVIVLPCENYSDTELQFILRHELTHYDRHDTIIKWLVVAVKSLHWFNPLMPVIAREVNELCEYACDRAVTCRMDATERRAYIRTILKTAARQSHISLLPTAALSGSAKRLERRLADIALQGKRTPSNAWTAVTAVSLVLAVGISLGTVPFRAEDDRAPTVSQSTATEQVRLAPSSTYAPRRGKNFTKVWYRYGYERMAFQFTDPEAVFDEKQALWFSPRYPDGWGYKPTLSGATEDYDCMDAVFRLLDFEQYDRVGETMTMAYFPDDALEVIFYNELYFYLDRGGNLLVWLDFQYVKQYPHSRSYPDYLEREPVISVYHVPNELFDQVVNVLYRGQGIYW